MRIIFSLLLVFSVPLYAEAGNEPTDEEALIKAKKVLSRHTGSYNERQIERIGNKTIQFEAYASIEADAKLEASILSDFKNFPKWIIKNINHKPGGGSYYVKVQELRPDPKDSGVLHGFFNIDVPIFRTVLYGLFRLSSEEKKGVFTVRGKMVPADSSVLESAEAVLRSFPTEKPSAYRWIYVYSTVVLKNWLLYEAFPERLLKRESGERIQIVLDNYQAEEDRLRKH